MAAKPARAVAPIVARTAAATIGGYAFSYSAAAALSRALPMADAEIVILTAFLAIVLHLVIAVSAFGCRSITGFWVGLAAGSIALYAAAFGWPA